MRIANRALPVFVLLFLFIFTSCERLFQPPRPPGVPEGARRDRRMGVWNYLSPAGEYRRFYSDGKTAIQGRIIKNMRQGLWRFYSIDGKTLVAEGKCLNNLRDGVWRFHDDRGRLYMTKTYRPTPVRNFGLVYTIDYGNENGPYERYFEDGRLEERGFYRGGYYEGNLRRYYRNGKPAVEGRYKKDLKAGVWRYYYPEGGLERTEEYRAGLLWGNLKNYRPDGSLRQIAVFHRGKLQKRELFPARKK